MNGRLTLSASVIVIGGLALGVGGRMCEQVDVQDGQRGRSRGPAAPDEAAAAPAGRTSRPRPRPGNIEGIAVNAETLAIDCPADPGPVPGGLRDREVEGQARGLAEVARVRGGGQEPGDPGGEAARRGQGEERAADAGPREGLRPERVRHLPHPVPPAAAPDVAARPHRSGPAPPAPRAGPAP